jgi:hypothetical protein
METLSNFEKSIFNCHLATTRSQMGKPFKLRKNFKSLDDSAVFYLHRLQLFFNKFPEVNMREYFLAPYIVHKDTAYYDLAFYASPKAIKTWSLFQKQKLLEDMDTQLDSVKESFGFIGDFCLENNLTWSNYIDMDKDIPLWLIHTKEGRVAPYALFAIPNIAEKIQNLGSELAELYLGDFGLDIYNQKLRFMKTSKLKAYIEKIIPKLTQLLDKNKK